ncbi:MAG: ABC transporter ATP-binding protein [Clostridia bacterium]|nr:ABC transporter ATP-binding protein [Clostridia bacterium]
MHNGIHLDRVSMAFGEKKIFSDLSLSFSAPGQYAILGPSGRGKTTLLRLIAGLEKPLTGTVAVPKDMRISFCFQEDRLLPWKTVLENIALVSDTETARCWLDRVGLAAEEQSFPASLSGGMKRRAALARALAYDADILLMDEPFRALDEATHEQMLALVCNAAKGKLLILVTHDEADAHGMQIVRI